MLERRAWLTIAGNRIVEGFFTHLHLCEYEFAMDRPKANPLTPTSFLLICPVLKNPTISCRGYPKSTCHTFVTLVSDLRMKRWRHIGSENRGGGRLRFAAKATQHNQNHSLLGRLPLNGYAPLNTKWIRATSFPGTRRRPPLLANCSIAI